MYKEIAWPASLVLGGTSAVELANQDEEGEKLSRISESLEGVKDRI